MASQEAGVTLAERGRHVPAEFCTQDEVARFGESRDVRRDEQVRLVGDRPKRYLQGGERDRVHGMGVHDGSDIGSCAHYLGVDRVFGVPATAALEHFAVPRNENNVVSGDLFETKAGRFHEDAAAIGITSRHVAPNEIAVPGGS